MFAIVTISGKQYRVKEGDQIKIANLENQVGDKIEFDKILLLENSKKLTVGEPYVNDTIVSATVLKDSTPDPFVVSACPFVPSAVGNFKNTPVLIVGELSIV